MKAYFFVLDPDGDFEHYAQVNAVEVEYGVPADYIADYGSEPTYPQEEWVGGVALLSDDGTPSNTDLFAHIHLATPDEGPLPAGYRWYGDQIVKEH